MLSHARLPAPVARCSQIGDRWHNQNLERSTPIASPPALSRQRRSALLGVGQRLVASAASAASATGRDEVHDQDDRENRNDGADWHHRGPPAGPVCWCLLHVHVYLRTRATDRETCRAS